MPVDPSDLRILEYPAPALRTRATVVPELGPELRAVAQRMIDLMREAEGIGLAATQIGLSWRVFVADLPEREPGDAAADPALATPGAVVYLDPVLSRAQAPLEPFEEGCLSLPEIRGEVVRPAQITITARNLEGQTFATTGAALLARCWQHEVDHLDGILIIDRMTQMARLKNRTAVRELQRKAPVR